MPLIWLKLIFLVFDFEIKVSRYIIRVSPSCHIFIELTNMNRNRAYDVFIATGTDLTNKLYRTRIPLLYT